MKKLLLTSSLALCAASFVHGAWPYDQVDKVDVDPLGRLVADWRGAAPKKPHRVLLFSECFGYNHHGGRCYGDWTFTKAGELSGAWAVEKTTNVAVFADAAYLAEFDAILFCNSSGLRVSMAPGMEKTLLDYVKGGKGVALIHAGLDAFKDSDPLCDLFGGYFRGHPWHEDGSWKIRNERPADPVNAPFAASGASFFKTDELYQFPAFFDRSKCNVLLSVDLSDSVTKAAEEWWEGFFGKGSTRHDHDYAVSWTKTAGKGRIFYTTFGHDRTAFLDRERLYHMFAGLQYVLGDLEPAAAHDPAKAEQRLDWANGACLDQMRTTLKAAKGETFDFVAVGDSITMLWSHPFCRNIEKNRAVWDKHFGKMKTMNLGVSGDRTEHLLWRITDGGQADGWKAKTIFLMIGINNHGQTKDSPAATAAGTKAVLETLKTKHPESKIVLFGALPWAAGDGFKWVREYNAILAGFAGDRVVFRDMGGRFMLAPDRQKAELFADGLHPNAAGYELFADEMKAFLAE